MFTGRYTEEMSYQENLLPKYHAIDGHEVIMLTTCYKIDEKKETLFTPPVDKIISNGIRLVRMDYHKIINNYITRKIRKVDGTFQFIKLLLPDIIFFHGPQSIELVTASKYVKENPYVKMFVDNHADYINSGTNWFSKHLLHKIFWKYCIKKAEPYVTKFYGVTPLRCDFLRKMYNVPSYKIELLVMGADDNMIDFSKKNQKRQIIRNALKISKNDFVLVTGGKIDERKNIHLLMQAVNELKFENVKLILFGTPEKQMKTIIENLSKSDRIRNIGWIESIKVYDYFLASDLAVFPGTHSVLWEQSVGTGIPGIFKHWEGMEHIDIGGNCRFLYTDEVKEIKSTLEEIINNPNDYKKMRKVAEEIGIKAFSYKEICRKAIQY